MTRAFRLAVGSPAPRQSGPTDCGPTALTVARMLVDPQFARWVDTGGGLAPLSAAGSDPQSRFTAYVQAVHRRAVSVVGPTGGLQLPWPRRLGTPPWGICRELETLARPAGTRYRAVLVRCLTPQRRAGLLEALAAHVGAGRPGAIIVGSDSLPRHVGLFLPSQAGGLAVYDPGQGTVAAVDAHQLSEGQSPVGGWPQPWWFIGPVG